jgi:hypothetical protein
MFQLLTWQHCSEADTWEIQLCIKHNMKTHAFLLLFKARYCQELDKPLQNYKLKFLFLLLQEQFFTFSLHLTEILVM